MTLDIVGDLLETWTAVTKSPAATTYDEVLREVAARAEHAHCLSKADFGALVVWKRLRADTRWAKSLMETPDSRVRQVTHDAWVLANDESLSIPRAGRAAQEGLWQLPGCGGSGAVASAILVALSPGRMAVWDRRARESLRAYGREPSPGNGRYQRYLEIVEELASDVTERAGGPHAFTPRDIDLSLYHLAHRVTKDEQGEYDIAPPADGSP